MRPPARAGTSPADTPATARLRNSPTEQTPQPETTPSRREWTNGLFVLDDTRAAAAAGNPQEQEQWQERR